MKKEKKPIYKKWWVWALIILVVIIIVGMGGDDNTNTVKPSTETSATSNGTSNENTKVKVGEEISTNDAKITFISASDYTSYKQYSAPKSGNKIIRAEFSFENISNSDIYLDNIDCYADGEKCETYYSADDYKSPTLESLSAGKKVKAIVYYEVPINAGNIMLEYETNIWTNSKIEFIVK